MTKKPLLTKEQMKTKYPDQGREDIHRALKNHAGNLCIHFTGSLPRDTGVLFVCPV